MTTQDDSGTHATLAESGDNTNSQELPRGSNLGRYVIIEPIGSGGMGIVYRAYDPQLNRGVALKILSVKQADLQSAERAKARLIREAQALAQLSHPNVVAVHDAGTFEDDVFIAMELVEGKTLNDWLKEEKREVKEILEVMIAAGRGLSAAHKAGLVHRDFKPGNVIIGDDGRVRVLDFGLARAVSSQESEEDSPKKSQSVTDLESKQAQESINHSDLTELSSSSTHNLLLSPLTQVGGILGTPLYMAPEQLVGENTDERTDQFGFCVVLYENLYKKRPYKAKTIEQLKKEIYREQVRMPASDTNVPGWLWQVIRKGLSAEPHDRFPTLESLLEELENDPEEARRQKRSRRTRRLLLTMLVALATAGPIGVWYGLRYTTVQRCKASDGESSGVWDEGTRASIQKSFLRTKKSFARETWSRVQGFIGRYLADWTQMRSQVCEATWLHGTQSEELFDLRMRCLGKRMGELKALLKVFIKADAEVVQNASQASSSLVGISTCADEDALRAPYTPPKTEEARVKVESIRDKLAEVVAFNITGKYREGLQLADKIEIEARQVGYQPVRAEVLYCIGDLLDRYGEYKKAETTLHEAARVAGENGDGLLAAKAMTTLVWVIGESQERFEDGLLFGKAAEVIIGVARGDEILKSRLYNNLGVVHRNKGDHERALSYYQKSLAIRQKALGPEHPSVGKLQNNMGSLFHLQGDYDKALEYYRRSHTIYEKALGPDHPTVSWPLYNMAIVFQERGEYKKALEYHFKALDIYQAAVGPEHPGVGNSMLSICDVFKLAGEYDKALTYCLKALYIFEKTLGISHPQVSPCLSSLGRVFLEKGMTKEAFVHLERSVRLCHEKSCRPELYARSLFELARALFMTGGDRGRVIRLSKQAREIFDKTPKRFTKELKQVDSWLKRQDKGTSTTH